MTATRGTLPRPVARLLSDVRVRRNAGGAALQQDVLLKALGKRDRRQLRILDATAGFAPGGVLL